MVYHTGKYCSYLPLANFNIESLNYLLTTPPIFFYSTSKFGIRLTQKDVGPGDMLILKAMLYIRHGVNINLIRPWIMLRLL